MRPIAPRIPGLEEVTVAEEQEEYRTITAGIVRHDDAHVYVTRWTMTAEERARVAAGEDVYVRQLMFRPGMTPIVLSIGAPSPNET
jgi:hypothetical protein